eukprot:SAG11_NODE_277_length_11302_cov_5.987146_7_plen_104_part_00
MVQSRWAGAGELQNTMENNSVNSNKIVRSNTQLFDCGSIYTLSAQPNSEIAHNFIQNQVLLFGSLYHDAQSAYFHTHHNVVSGEQNTGTGVQSAWLVLNARSS